MHISEKNIGGAIKSLREKKNLTQQLIAKKNNKHRSYIGRVEAKDGRNIKIYNHIKKVLEQNEKFCKDGKLLKNVIVEAGLKLDPKLLFILLTDKTAKKYFLKTLRMSLFFIKSNFKSLSATNNFYPTAIQRLKIR